MFKCKLPELSWTCNFEFLLLNFPLQVKRVGVLLKSGADLESYISLSILEGNPTTNFLFWFVYYLQ